MSSAMFVALKVVVLLSRATATDPAVEMLGIAARQALGPDAQVEIVTLPDEIDERRARAYAHDADGAVVVEWSEGRARARLYIYNSNASAEVERRVVFQADDAEPDKGRHLGLLIGSLFDAAAPPHRSSVVSQLQPGPASAVAQSEQAAVAGGAPRDEPDGVASAPDLESARSARGGQRVGWTLDAVLSTPLGAAGGGVGANLSFMAALESWLWWQLSVGAQAGEVPAAQATTQMVRAGSGLEFWTPLAASFGLGVRSELLASWLQVGHLSSDDPAVDRKHRWDAGLSVLLAAQAVVNDSSAIVLSSGLEAWSGRTDLYTHGRRVATLAQLRWVTSLGLRISY